eukprot:6289157-Amphidinium_carterae.1
MSSKSIGIHQNIGTMSKTVYTNVFSFTCAKTIERLLLVICQQSTQDYDKLLRDAELLLSLDDNAEDAKDPLCCETPHPHVPPNPQMIKNRSKK